MKEIIIYGAGKFGKALYNQIKSREDVVVKLFCDKSANDKGKDMISGLPCLPYDLAIKEGFSFLVAVQNPKIAEEVCQKLENDNQTVIELGEFFSVDDFRDFCANYHIDNMNHYFEKVESVENLQAFWEEESVFKRMFNNLDLENVIELACGHGRHVQMYAEKAKNITLVDILEKNIEICKKRFNTKEHIHFYKNNGYDLAELESNSYSALFTYDAMVHFELFDINSYLAETHRVLKKGGMALFHHSNNGSDYKASFQTAPHGRNFMSKEIFAYLAYRNGFKIIEQKVIDWGEKDLDCITLLMK